mmetsp:Transcript_29491/g.58769  ORF Transcript_29491/g.58769 Transcript_29491/m.58769 type:complete len:439 (+) Transcript_29491:177-1493(+)
MSLKRSSDEAEAPNNAIIPQPAKKTKEGTDIVLPDDALLIIVEYAALQDLENLADACRRDRCAEGLNEALMVMARIPSGGTELVTPTFETSIVTKINNTNWTRMLNRTISERRHETEESIAAYLGYRPYTAMASLLADRKELLTFNNTSLTPPKDEVLTAIAAGAPTHLNSIHTIMNTTSPSEAVPPPVIHHPDRGSVHSVFVNLSDSEVINDLKKKHCQIVENLASGNFLAQINSGGNIACMEATLSQALLGGVAEQLSIYLFQQTQGAWLAPAKGSCDVVTFYRAPIAIEIKTGTLTTEFRDRAQRTSQFTISFTKMDVTKAERFLLFAKLPGGGKAVFMLPPDTITKMKDPNRELVKVRGGPYKTGKLTMGWTYRKPTDGGDGGTYSVIVRSQELHMLDHTNYYVTVRDMFSIMMKEFIYVGYVPLTDSDPVWLG